MHCLSLVFFVEIVKDMVCRLLVHSGTAWLLLYVVSCKSCMSNTNLFLRAREKFDISQRKSSKISSLKWWDVLVIKETTGRLHAYFEVAEMTTWNWDQDLKQCQLLVYGQKTSQVPFSSFGSLDLQFPFHTLYSSRKSNLQPVGNVFSCRWLHDVGGCNGMLIYKLLNC